MRGIDASLERLKIIALLEALGDEPLRRPDVRERLRPEGIEPGTLDPREFTDFVAAEVRRWTPVVRASGVRSE